MNRKVKPKKGEAQKESHHGIEKKHGNQKKRAKAQH
jgi:hypothetical protein